jgi:hypothetical protein
MRDDLGVGRERAVLDESRRYDRDVEILVNQLRMLTPEPTAIKCMLLLANS